MPQIADGAHSVCRLQFRSLFSGARLTPFSQSLSSIRERSCHVAQLLHRVVATSLLCLVFSAASEVWAQYAITDLGVLSGYAAGVATGVNSSGVVVGYCNTVPVFGGGQAFIAAGGPPMTDLNSVLGTCQSAASGISDTGLVASIGLYGTKPHATIYNANTGVTTDLTTMPGFLNGVQQLELCRQQLRPGCRLFRRLVPVLLRRLDHHGDTRSRNARNSANAYALNNNGIVVGGS